MNDRNVNKTTEEKIHSESVIDVQQLDDINDQTADILPPKTIIVDDILSISIVACSNLEEHPESYRLNSKKEELILTFVENFRRQYYHIYRDRKSLFLNPFNECGIPKFVCTTIRPTILPYSDLTEWNLTANFIADHLNYDLLDPPYELPKTLSSPTKILTDQHGNCFDYANLLCSLLIGAGYDAYIVSGYATREICYMDTTRLPNPYIRKQQEEPVKQLKSQCKKYGVKPLKTLTSEYDAYMHQRHLNTIQEEKIKIQEEENQRIAEIERPISDPLYGVRIHAWILIRPGGRHEISEAFYIEPTTGYRKTADDTDYLGIESVWNHENLWVNMQDCSNGCQSLQFDLNDQARWECMFIHSNEKEKELTHKRLSKTLSNQIDWFEKMKFYFNNPLHLPVSNINATSYYKNYSDKIKSEVYKKYYHSSIPDITIKTTIHKDINLPLSWVMPLDITPKNFQKRYPKSHKIYYFKKTCVEKYAPYSKKDGIVLKISEFDDYNCKEFIYVTYHYEHRYDKLEIREHNIKMNTIKEKYRPGRNDHLKEYIYDFGPSYDRIMIYYHKSRLDSLSKRHETTHELTDYFIDHDNFLTYRKVIFEIQLKKSTQRSIISITEKFNRNPSLNSNEDIQELIFAIKDNKFIITYYRDINCITSSIRTYIKPSNWNDKAFIFKWNDNLHEIYQANDDLKQMSKRDLYYEIIKLIKEEEEAIKRVRTAENEIRDLQSRRQQEELSSDLEVSIYDIDRNEKSKIYKELLQQKTDEDKNRKNMNELDYLYPYIAAIGNPECINAQIAEQIRYNIELDFKNQSIYRANLIQSCYENEIKELLTKQQWYQNNHISKNDEFECEQAKFRLQILQDRLKEHEEFTRENYRQLEKNLNEDIRLKEPYIVR
ncbi:unnamed protein product [Adineta steineri]|uniref:Dynein regulatory complex subunit 7 n=1 Tax=Adineta steineri TaxID=433720 RepID=A0A814MR32_9BILA|nr:unnamed protein product [Adineta steineri]CAF1426887.1 unnamed protein product [Adineta steineri]